jgi:hypothetical protein
VPVSQAQATVAGDGLPLPGPRRDEIAAVDQAVVSPRWWQRLCLSSFAVGAVTIVIVWVAVTSLLRQGRLDSVLSAGRAELAAPLLVALVVATGICERIWPAERRPVLARGHVQDVCFLALHAIVVIPLMTLLSVGAATLLSSHAPWVELRATEHWPYWLLVPVTIVAMGVPVWSTTTACAPGNKRITTGCPTSPARSYRPG